MAYPLFPYAESRQQLRQLCPSAAEGRSWEEELAHRCQSASLVFAVGGALNLPVWTQEKAVLLLHRFYTRESSVAFDTWGKWAVATACVFLASKIDSAYHRLESVAHSAYVEMRRLQRKPLEPEYWQADQTGGNPAFLAQLASRVRAAEMQVLFAVNFDFTAGSVTSFVSRQLTAVGLGPDARAADPALEAAAAFALKQAALCVSDKRAYVLLLYPVPELAAACIYRACLAHRLDPQQRLRPLPQHADGLGKYLPRLPLPRLQAIEMALPGPSRAKPLLGLSRSSTPGLGGGAGGPAGSSSQTSAGAGPGCQGAGAGARNGPAGGGQQRGSAGAGAADSSQGAAHTGLAGKASSLPAGASGSVAKLLQLQQHAVAQAGPAGSGASAATAGPRLQQPSPISPDSLTGPSDSAGGSAAQAVSGGGPAGSSGSKGARRVTFSLPAQQPAAAGAKRERDDAAGAGPRPAQQLRLAPALAAEEQQAGGVVAA